MPDFRGDTIGWLAWGALGVVAALLDSNDPGRLHEWSQPAIASVTLGFGVITYWSHGRNRVTAAGLYALAAAIFAGYAGLWWTTQHDMVSNEIYRATTWAFWTTWLMSRFWGRGSIEGPLHLTVAEPGATRWGIRWGLGLAIAGIGSHLVGIQVGQTFVGEVAFVGLTLLAVSLILRRSESGVSRALVVTTGSLAVYSTTIFSGFGRLVLVSLILGPVVLLAGRLAGRRLKVMSIVAIGPALAVFAAAREVFGRRKYGTDSLSGIGSVVEPLRDFGRLLGRSDGYSFAYGDTFWAALTVHVPRAVWPGKPIGFGTELTQMFAPELASVGQTYVVLTPGEWYYNFGVWGLLAMAPALGLFLRLLDGALLRAQSTPAVSPRQLLWLTMALVAVADVPNLFWAGSFGYTARAGTRLLVLAALVVLATARPAAPAEPNATPLSRASPRRARR